MKGKSYHFIGIGGVGMSALARIALERGAEVSGSDKAVSGALVRALQERGVAVYEGHEKGRASQSATIVYSGDIKPDNLEIAGAKEEGQRLLHRAEMLAELMQTQKGLLVTGTHGKTTTSSLLAHLLIDAGCNPSYAIGGILKNRGTNGAYGSGDYFVAEADESDGSFLKYPGYGAIVTNVDFDHMNYWGTEERLLAGFREFMEGVESESHLFYCIDSPLLEKIATRGISYGFSAHAHLRASDLESSALGTTFTLEFNGTRYEKIFLPLMGSHNVQNATAIFGLGLNLGLTEQQIRSAFASFSGAGRRLDKRGEVGSVAVFDDYGHHPVEVATTLKGMQPWLNGRRLIVVFQPHRFSRTQECLHQWKEAFEFADSVIVTDVYGAGEAPLSGLEGAEGRDYLARSIAEKWQIPVHSCARAEVVEFLRDYVRPHDVCLTSGAGDVTLIGPELLEALERTPPKKYQLGVVFGGKSNENSVSLTSAAGIIPSLNSKYYTFQQFGISQAGQWLTGREKVVEKTRRAAAVAAMEPGISAHVLGRLAQCDIVLPILHGPFGEDGVIQGFFDTLGLAYVGCDHRASAVCMDKGMTKKIALHHGIQTAPFVEVCDYEWKMAREKEVLRVVNALKFPLFVKPSYFGSSRSVFQVHTPRELASALDSVCLESQRVVVEEKNYGREIEIALLGNEQIFIGSPGEILTGGAVYDFDKKYGECGMKASPCAILSEAEKKLGQQLALRLYKAIGCTGLARIDFFFTDSGQWILNEVNPIPGFTPISLYPKMMEASGISYSELIDKLIICGLQRKRKSDRMSKMSLRGV